jgi:hypothetical protein
MECAVVETDDSDFSVPGYPERLAGSALHRGVLPPGEDPARHRSLESRRPRREPGS